MVEVEFVELWADAHGDLWVRSVGADGEEQVDYIGGDE